MAFQGKLPKLAIVVDIQEVFSHCPKAFMRSKLWAVESQIDRRELPSFAEILRDHAALGECDLDERSVNSTTERSQCCISVMAERTWLYGGRSHVRAMTR